jgi:iron complex transport system substrate-binding protein
MRRKILISMVLAALLVFAAVQAGAASSYPMEITDATGMKVILKAEPIRIVSIVPSVTEMLYSVGLGPKMVGVTAWCTYPEAAKSVAKVGDVNINIEAVLSKKPDLVVADLSMSGTTIDKLRELGLPVLAISAENMEEMLDALVMLGRAGGRENEALALVANLKSRIAKIKGILTAVKTRPSVFVEIWNEPLMTAGSGTYVNELIELAGGMNIAGKVSGWPVFSHESVISGDPFIILLTNFNKGEAMSRKAWSGLTAVKSGRVVETDPDLLVRCGPRLVDGLEMLAKLLHPELFK